MISQKSIQEVLGLAQVQDIIEDYVSLKRRGVNMLGLCPFHDEKTPSFTVSPSKNIFKCFGCGKGGGPVQFLMEHNSVSFPEAIRLLAGRYNITLEEDSKEDSEKYAEQRKLEESYFIINDFALEYYQNNLRNTQDGKLIGLSYFKERGYIDATIEKFQLGYALSESKALTEKAIKKQFKPEYLEELGLTSKKGYDFFRSRVMFPIHSIAGKVIGFAGRTLSTDKSQPKYINSPETPIYNKRKVLYGMHLAKNSIRKKDFCLIVEGYTDVISLVQNGVENVAASSGTSLTQEQVRLIKRYTDNITFLFDGDAAGVKAALRGLDIVLENGMNVSIVSLPEGEDPDSYIQSVGNARFEEYIKSSAKDFIFFKMDLLLSEAADDPIQKSKLIKDIIGSVAKLRDPIKRSLYVQRCSERLQIDEAILVKEVNKQIRKEIKQKDLEKVRLERQKQRADNSAPGAPPPSDVPFPNEPYPFSGEAEMPTNYHELDHYPEEQISHEQPTYKKIKHEYQEKDLARIVILSGDEMLDIEEEQMSVAEFVFVNTNALFQYFDNSLYQRIIEDAFKYVESEQEQGTLTNYFVNHSDEVIAKFTVDSMSSPYEFASWNNIGVYLNQKMPDQNFTDDSMQSVLRFKQKKTTLIKEDIKKRIAQESDESKKELLILAFMKVQEQLKEVSDKLGNVIL